MKFSPITDSRDWLTRVVKNLKMRTLQTIWGKSDGHIYAWAADRMTNGEHRENPVEKLDETIGFLMNSGADGMELAKWPALHFADKVGCDIVSREIKRDGSDIRDLMLDNDIALSCLHAAMRKRLSPDAIRMLGQELFNEVNEAIERYGIEAYEQLKA